MRLIARAEPVRTIALKDSLSAENDGWARSLDL